MKILYVLKSNSYSGAEHVVCTIIKNLPPGDEGIYISTKGPIEERLCKEGIAYYGLDRFDVRSLRTVIRRYQPDIVHAHDFTASVMCALACGKKQKLISHIHCNPSWLQNRNSKTLTYLVASRRFDKIVIVSDSIRWEYCYAGKMADQFVTLGNPFSMQEILDKSEEKTDVPSCDVIWVGRLSGEKNPIFFLDIIAETKKEKPHIKAVMIGDGQLRQSCRDRIREQGLQENVIMTGFQENPYVYMKQAKMICIPSHWEGFGLSALEAMALGKPVVASPAGGLCQLVNDKCGKLCSTQEDFVREIIQLMDDEVVYRGKSDGAEEQAARYDNVGQYIKRMVQIYSSLLSG